jgi:hypothetical protein
MPLELDTGAREFWYDNANAIVGAASPQSMPGQ